MTDLITPLTNEYVAWLDKSENANVEKGSADDSLMAVSMERADLQEQADKILAQIKGLTIQACWLDDFCERWEQASNDEREAHNAAGAAEVRADICKQLEDTPHSWNILCNVSGGVTGNRTALLKERGEVMEFLSRDEAEDHAQRLTKAANDKHATAVFSYTAVEA